MPSCRDMILHRVQSSSRLSRLVNTSVYFWSRQDMPPFPDFRLVEDRVRSTIDVNKIHRRMKGPFKTPPNLRDEYLAEVQTCINEDFQNQNTGEFFDLIDRIPEETWQRDQPLTAKLRDEITARQMFCVKNYMRNWPDKIGSGVRNEHNWILKELSPKDIQNSIKSAAPLPLAVYREPLLDPIYHEEYDHYGSGLMWVRYRHQNNLLIKVRSRHDPIKINATPAELKAQDTLRDMLTERDWRRYATNGFVVIKSQRSGNQYQIFKSQRNIQVYNNGKKTHSICIHTNRECPPTDHVINMMLLIELDEDHIWSGGNVLTSSYGRAANG